MDDRLRLLVKLAPSDPDAAMTVFAQTQGESGVRLTGNQASSLLEALARHNRLGECEQLWDDYTGRGLTLKPFAYAAVTRALMQQGKHDLALSRVQQLMSGESEPWVLDLAMKTAIKAQRNDVVADVLKMWGIKDVPKEVRGRDGVLRVLNGLRDRGVQLSEPTLRSLEKFATSDSTGEFAPVVSSLMRSAGVEPSIDCYSAAITGRGQTKRWGDVIELYESMTNESRLRLDALPLSVVITAHASVNNKELNLQAQKIFENCRFERNGDVLAAGLLAYLKNDKTEIVRGLLESMERRGVALDHLDIKQVVQAHICCGSVEKAELLLQKEKERLIDKSAACYRELIKHHVENDHDPQHTFDLYLDMIRSNSRLPLNDWKKTTELAMQLSDTSKYWTLRKLMAETAPSIEKMIPPYIIFPGKGKAKPFRGTTLSESSTLSRSRALEIVKEMQDTEGFSVSPDTASALLLSLAQQKCADECVEVLRYCRAEGIPLKVNEYFTAFHQLYSDRQFSQAMQLFNGLLQNDVKIEPWAYGFAMDAAFKTSQHELAGDLFQRLISGRDEASGANSTGDVVADIIHVLRERGNDLSESVLRSLVFFANKSRQADLALELLAVAKSKRLEPMGDIYESALVACGQDRRWSDVVKVYEDMPDHFRSRLNNLAMTAVVQAHVGSDSDKLKSRGMELFDSLKGKMTRFTWNVMLETHLQANEFESLLAVADEMQQGGMEWDEYTTKMVILAHLRSGAVETARQVLSSSRTLLEFQSSECYRELIEHYTDTLRDPQAASELYVEMMQDNARLPESDWHNALKVSMQLPDSSLYWEIRNRMARYAPALSKNLPAHLQLQSTISSSAAANPARALQFATGLQSTQAVSLSANVASVLLNTLSQHDHVDECVNVLNYCYEHGIRLRPFAQLAAFKALNDSLKYAELLLLFDYMRRNDPQLLAPWRYAAALDAASQLNRPEAAAEIFHYLVPEGAERRLQGGLLLDVFSTMRRKGMTPLPSMYKPVLTTYGRYRRWGDVIDAYESMPYDAQMNVTGTALGMVIAAYSKADTDEMQLRALALFKQHEEKWPRFVWNAVLEVHLQTGQYEAVLPLAEAMLDHDLAWNRITYKTVILASIRNGAIDKAEGLLRAKAGRMGRDALECYRELIEYHATHGDTDACMGVLELLQTSSRMQFSDWYDVLEMAIQLPDKSLYWKIRKRAPMRRVPDHLNLPLREWTKKTVPSQVSVSDPNEALTIAQEIQSTKTLTLSPNVASVMLETLANHNFVEECVKILDYCVQQGYSPKPFALSAAFRTLYDGQEYAHVLLLFEEMRKTKSTGLAAWRYAAALDAASQLDQPKVVADIFHRLVFDGADSRETSLTGDTVRALLQDLRRQGVAPSEFALNALAVYAEKSAQPDLLLDVFSTMRRQGKTPTIGVFASALVAYGSAGRWEHVIEVYESMPRKAREHLTSNALGRVIMAYSNADTDEKKLRALEIFDQNDERWPRAVWNAVLYVHLQVGEYEAVLPVAEDMAAHGKRWNSFTYKMLVLADIRRGNVDRAESRLRDTIDLMDDKGAECYRELIPYYADTRGDLVGACVRCLEMVENSGKLTRSDWWSALELVMQLPDDSVYWHVRKQIKERAPHLRIPKRLLRSESDNKQGSEAVLRKEKDSEPSLRHEEEPVIAQPLEKAPTPPAKGATPPERSVKGNTLFGWIRNKLWPTD